MPDPGASAGTARRTVLLVDEDPRIGRLVRLTLHGPECQVVTCTRHLEGLRIAARQKPDLILMDTVFKGADGLALGGKLLQAPETQGSALAFLTSEDSLLRRFTAIQMGAAEYILKPLEGKVLGSRVGTLFARLERGRRGAVSGPAVERLLPMLERLEREGGSGTISLQRGTLAARVAISFGDVTLAECGALRGEEALNEIAAHGDWSISLSESAPDEEEDDDDAIATGERRRRITDVTRPASPKMVKHVPSSLTNTVMDAAVSQPRSGRSLAPEAGFGDPLAPAPGFADEDALFGDDDDERTVVDPMQQSLLEVVTQPAGRGQRAAEVVVQPTPARAGPEEITLTRPQDDDGGSVPTAERIVDTPYETGEMPQQAGPAVDEHLIDEPGEGFDEDVPTAMSFKAELDLSDPYLRRLVEESTAQQQAELEAPSRSPDAGGAPAAQRPPSGRARLATPAQTPLAPSKTPLAPSKTPPQGGATPSRESLRRWLQAQGGTVLLVVPPPAVRAVLQQAAESLGLAVLAVQTGLEAYTTALQRHPTAILADLRGQELDGRELLAAIRSDFHVRETPFIMLSSEFLASQVEASGAAAVAPIVQGLEAALAPRVLLEERLQAGEAELRGWVEPIGTAHLLRAIARVGHSGRLVLRKDAREAVIIFQRGQLCGCTVNLGQPTVGPLGMLQLLGYEWVEYVLTTELPDPGQVPLGDLAQLIETAFQQNNILLARVYQQGLTSIEDVTVDSTALDLYLQKLPPGSLELLIRIVEGERAAALVEQGVAAPGLLKSILHDLRRKGVILVSSLRPVRLEGERAESAPAPARGRPRRFRWLVILLAGLLTAALAVGGYLVYERVMARRRAQVTAAGTGTSTGSAAGSGAAADSGAASDGGASPEGGVGAPIKK